MTATTPPDSYVRSLNRTTANDESDLSLIPHLKALCEVGLSPWTNSISVLFAGLFNIGHSHVNQFTSLTPGWNESRTTRNGWGGAGQWWADSEDVCQPCPANSQSVLTPVNGSQHETRALRRDPTSGRTATAECDIGKIPFSG